MAYKRISKVRNPELKGELELMCDGIETMISVPGTPIAPVSATDVLTLATIPTAGNTVTIGAEVYTFTATAGGVFDVVIGATVAESQTALKTAIDTNSAIASCSAFALDAVTVTITVAGVAGNFIDALSTLAGIGDGFATPTFAGGIDGTVGFAGKLMYGDGRLYVSSGESTVAVSNWLSTALA